jgi:hypothetical protein
MKTIGGIGLAGLLLLAGCCNPAVTAAVPVPITGQQQSNWCWAASGQMTMNYIHPASNVVQCQEANQQFGQTTCCQNGGSSACNNGGWPQYQNYGFSADVTNNAPLSWADIRSQIGCSGKPFAFSWHWPGGGGHMMVVSGYTTVEGTNYVQVNDPLPVGAGSQYMDTYDFYNTAPGQHTHWNDYYNITYTGAQ